VSASALKQRIEAVLADELHRHDPFDEDWIEKASEAVLAAMYGRVVAQDAADAAAIADTGGMR
jgi:hypothetical protein